MAEAQKTEDRRQGGRRKECGAQVFLLRFTIHGSLADPLVSPLTGLNFLLLAPCSLLFALPIVLSRRPVVSSRWSCSLLSPLTYNR
jgi:hypothetical protein